jgi:RNA polymerase sigma-70 factor (ECF subfamily)
MTVDWDDTIPTRRSLLERLKNWQDQKSWLDFFDTYWKLIYGVARQSGLTDSEAQDVVQETMITVAKKMDSFKTDPAFGSFKSWLMLITRRRIQDQFRKRPPRGELTTPGSESPSRTPTLERVADRAAPELETIWEAEWQKNIVSMALEEVKKVVSSKQFLLFYQQTFKGWPPSRVAKQYGVSLARVYMAKYRVAGVLKREVTRLEKQLI